MSTVTEDRKANPRAGPESYWFREHVGDCPCCGCDVSWRERMTGPQPASETDRFVLIPLRDCYDGCLEVTA